MPRSIRIEYEGAFYHVMARGNRREAIFLNDEDRRRFLKTLGEACAKTGWRVHAWVLMGNHYHLMIETPESNLVEGMKWLQNTVTRRFNVRHREWGRLFGDRYKAIIVEGAAPFYYESLMDYIHLNPVRAGLVQPSRGQSVREFPWSSVAAGYALPPRRRPKWLAAETGLGIFGFADTADGRRRMVERLDRRAVEEAGEDCGVPPLPEEIDARCSHLRRGWYWGTRRFAGEMLKLAERTIMRTKSRASRSAPERKAHGLDQAERWLKEGMAAAGFSERDLRSLPGNHPVKAALARLLWTRTTVSQVWLAERLGMRSAANVCQVLRKLDERSLRAKLPIRLKKFLDSAVIETEGRDSRFAP